MNQVEKLDIDALLAHTDETLLQQPSLQAKKSIVYQLQESWVRERLSPDLCEYPDDIIKLALEGLDTQRQIIDELEAIGNRFLSVLLQTELERVSFLLRSLLRCRLCKIESFPIYYSQELTKLADVEKQYLRQFCKIFFRQMNKSILDHLPVKARKLDDSQGRNSMIETPNLEKTVFCRIEDVDTVNELVINGEVIPLERNSILLLKYSAVAPYIGKFIELV